jgi:hypothetical protein
METACDVSFRKRFRNCVFKSTETGKAQNVTHVFFVQLETMQSSIASATIAGTAAWDGDAVFGW